MQLPEVFLEEMKTLLKEDYPAYQDSLLQVPYHGIRANTLKVSADTLAELLKEKTGLEAERVPFVSNGFLIGDVAPFSGHPWFPAGLYYIQEPSAMAPAENLPVEPGDRVLDLCAAPGGKATELAAKLCGRGFLLANDISASRAQALRKNLMRAGVTNSYVTAEEPAKLASHFPAYFDKILVDAPCSGEGMFRREPSMASYYRERGPEAYVPIQREILTHAVSMLAPGGMLLFSTCTFSSQENERNVLFLLENHADLSPAPLPARHESFAPGVLPGTEHCARIYPHRAVGEGQFLALFKKDGERPSRGAEKSRVFEKNGEVFLLPGSTLPAGNLRYLLTGLHIGTRKKKGIVPSQALAQTLTTDSWDTSLSLAPEDPRVMKYLKGETISYSDDELTAGKNAGEFHPELSRREILVAVDSFGIGFAVRNGSLLKNRMDPGWRIL